MGTIVVSHGYGATPDSMWFPYLRRLYGDRVRIPALPGPVPSPDTWLKTLAEHTQSPGNTVLIGHSIGGVNILRLLEAHTGKPFAGVVLVSVPAAEVGYPEVAGFFAGGFDWAKIRGAARNFRVLAALDDPVNVPDPARHALTFVRELGAVARICATGGHFGISAEDRFDLPEAVTLIDECFA